MQNPKTEQSVYIADKDLVKIYPGDMTNEQIDYDIHTEVRGQSPEDYHINFLPFSEIQKGWRTLEINAPKILRELAEPGIVQAVKGVDKALKAEKEYVTPAMKLAVSDPAYAFGITENINNPEALANTYKPWLDIWMESEVGVKVKNFNDYMFVNHPKMAAIPWFFTEFIPEQLLDFGTKASSWVGAFGVEKFGPPLINSALSKLPESARKILLKDIFASEKSLSPYFDTLGLKMNTKTSEVVDAYRKAAKVTHPDVGGSPEEFMRIKTAYEKIMQSRSGIMDKLFDYFRRSSEFKTRPAQGQPGIMGLLADQKGMAIIPFSEGDVVKFGKQVGRIMKLSGNVASVNVAGKLMDMKVSELTPANTAVNPDYMQIGEEGVKNIKEATEVISHDIENQTGKPLSHEEVIEKAKEAEILTKGVSREATLEFQASLLKTRQHLAALAEQNELTPEFLDTVKVMANLGTDIARNLESFKIDAMPEYASVKVKIIKDLVKLGKSSEEILKAAKGVNFQSEQEVAKFYRQFVKPKFSEILDEYVYINILSSPLTHIVNAFSNILQLSGLNPVTKLATGAIDFVASKLTGAERRYYISEVPDFYKGVLNSVPTAFSIATDIMKGKKTLERPDIKHIPTLSKLVDWGTLKVGKYVPRALEASDVFFRTMIEAGEVESMTRKLGHVPDQKEMIKIEKEAKKRADYYVFRQKTDAEDKTGQGKVLSAIDQLTNAVYRLRAVPGVKWFIRFVHTPMNIFKQGIEYSPVGVTTLFGSKQKTEQAGKAMVGSLVFAGASWLAMNNLTTWAAPTGEKEKQQFHDAGLQPYSVKIGDKWVSYSKLGPLSYPMAMAAALHYYQKESPNALSDTEMDKIADAFTGIMRFFADQSYMKGIGDLVSFARGEKTKALAGVPTQLIPLSSLQGWINNLIDPIIRKAEKGLSIESIVDQIQSKIVGASQFIPPQLDLEKRPSKKQLKEINAVSPLKMSKAHAGKVREYKERQKIKQEVNRIKKQFGDADGS